MQDCIDYCTKAWQEGGFALEGLKEIIRIPNLSPDYDPEFLTNGLIEKAIETMKAWIMKQGLKSVETEIFQKEGKEPLLIVRIGGETNEPIICYGHLDKMPHLDPTKWSEGLSATNPVVRGDRIYGRGTNDDCYNGFLIVTALKYLEEHNIKHPKVTLLLETGEESGDETISCYLKELRPKLGDASMIMVYDAEAEDYQTAWCCTSLRGVVNGVLTVEHLSTPCHSGMATGLVPSTFRIARMLISRIEDEQTGEVLLKEAHLPTLPEDRLQMCHRIADQLGEESVAIVTPLPGAKLLSEDRGQLLIDRAWKPGLAVTGCDGIPAIADGSNVMRPKTALKLSLRIPPGIEAEDVAAALKKTLEADPPYGAKVTYECMATGNGWYGQDFKPKIQTAMVNASKSIFGMDPLYYGDGGSIPLCNLFQKLWPDASVVVTGCAGVDSNPHGYDESLNIAYTGKTAALVAMVFKELAE